VDLSRRAALKGAALLGVSAFPARQAQAAGPVGAGGVVAPQHTTLAGTVVRGATGAGGYVHLASGPAEPHVVREELGTRASAGRAARRTCLASFAQLTDIHVVDAQSPARVEFLDRYNDGPGAPLVFGAAYRPHEMLTTQVADRIVAAVEQVGRGPVCGRPLDFVICTGDNNDNCQRNELRWQIDVLDGRTVRPDSGATTLWEGVHDQDATSYDVHYWHPDGTPSGKADDELRALYGFPVVKGLLDAARRPFRAHGVKRRWYTCYGNHDGLVQGNFPVSFQLTHAATGPLKLTSLPAGVSPADIAAADPTVIPKLAAAPARVVTADPERRIITRKETVQEHFTTGGLPLGHGYTSANVAAGTAYYTFEMAPHVRGIVLDTVNPNGYNDGSIDQTQLAWLTARLQEAKDAYLVVFSHHTIGSMTNSIVFVDDPSPRVLGTTVRDLLLTYPHVIAWVNGHTHVNRVTAHPRTGGGGFWEVNTASHVDWPAQARLLELVDNHDGTLSLFGTVIDAAVPLRYGTRLDTTTALASLARELAANDPQERGDARRGKVEDRNVELVLRAPFRLAVSGPPSTTPPPPSSGPVLPTTGLPAGAVVLAAGTVGAAVLVRRLRRLEQQD
jgi:metallophosphoesterase (TIGR03767 family)